VRIKSIVGIFAGVTFVGLLNFSIVETSWLSEQNLGAAKYPFVWEMTGAYTFLLLLPLVFLAATRFPIRRDNMATRIPLHAAVFVVFAVSHTLLMWGSRELIYYLLGWGHYDYGNMRYRFFMEGQKQFIVYVAVYSVLRFIAYARANRERDMTAARLERELTEARLAALKMQLQPHFLFNALNTIASHIEDDPRAAAAMVQHLSIFLRSTLRSSAAQEVPLRDEMDFLASYVAIMKARFEDRLNVTVCVPAELGDTLVPHLFLQPMVENAITHSLRDHAKRAAIRVAASRDGDRLRVTIEDNGPGLIDSAVPSGSGIGLSNTKARLQHLYGARQQLLFENRSEGGLLLTIEMPWHTAEEAVA